MRSFRILFYFKIPVFLFFERGVRIKNISQAKFGSWITIGEYTIIDALGTKGIVLGDNVSIGSFSRLIVSSNYSNIGEHIHIGNNVGIGSYSSIGGSGGVYIGENTIIAQYFSAHPENHIFEDLDALIKHQGTERKPIFIGSNCWIGAKVTVLAGVTIGDGSIIGAGSVITKEIPSNSIAVGNPAKIIRSR